MVRAPEVRVIDDEGQMLGVMSSREALEVAEDRGLDLVEVAPNANPPTCKVMDYGKYLYEQKKKAHESRKKQNIVSVKELQIRPRTDVHDINVKLRHAQKFLLEGDKVRINMRFRGREMAHREVGIELLKKMVSGLDELSMVEVEPKMEGNQLFVVIAPDKTKIEHYKKKQISEESAEA